MTKQRSALVLIVVPALVSLAITLGILTLWDGQRGTQERVIMLPTHSSTALVPPRATQPDATDEDGGSVAGNSGADEGGVPVVPTDEEPSDPGEEACENPIHTVASGEVLGSIGEQYGVTVDDIITLNQQLDSTFNPDFLSVGQAIVIPVCGIPTPSPTGIPSDTPVPTRNVPAPIPTATNPPPGAISLIIARVLNPGDITSEAVEIVNQGSAIDLADWTIEDEDENVFEFPAFRLFSGGSVTIYTGVGENTPIDLFWGLDEAVWDIGETVSLFDDEGELHSDFEVAEEE